MVSVYSTAVAVDGNVLLIDLTKVWHKALQPNYETLAPSYFAYHLFEVLEKVYYPARLCKPHTSIGKGPACIELVWISLYCEATKIECIHTVKHSWKVFVEGRICQSFLEKFYNAAVKSIGKPGREEMVASCMSTNWLLAIGMEKDYSRLKSARRRTALNIWVEMICATIEFDMAANEELHLTLTSGRNLLSGRDCPD